MEKLFSLFPVGEESIDIIIRNIYLKASTARIVLRGNLSLSLSWLGKNITRHYLPKGFTMLFLLTVISILVNELPRNMIRYQAIIFTMNKASENFVSSGVSRKQRPIKRRP